MIDRIANQVLAMLEGTGGLNEIEALKKKVDDENDWKQITDIVQIRLGRKAAVIKPVVSTSAGEMLNKKFT